MGTRSDRVEEAIREAIRTGVRYASQGKGKSDCPYQEMDLRWGYLEGWLAWHNRNKQDRPSATTETRIE
jgi:ribosome modulation factor